MLQVLPHLTKTSHNHLEHRRQIHHTAELKAHCMVLGALSYTDSKVSITRFLASGTRRYFLGAVVFLGCRTTAEIGQTCKGGWVQKPEFRESQVGLRKEGGQACRRSQNCSQGHRTLEYQPCMPAFLVREGFQQMPTFRRTFATISDFVRYLLTW